MNYSCRFIRILFVFCFLNLALAGSKTLMAQDADGDGFFAGVDDCDDTQWMYADNDGDGFGAGPWVGCGVTNNIDCDDTQWMYADNDGDGFGAGPLVGCGVTNNIDCDDWNPSIFPGNPEICDGMDNDCNGMYDDGLTFTTYYKDDDLDSFGRDWSQSFCLIPDSTWSLITGDCNDWDNTIFPGNPEICDSKDNDCDGLTDEGLFFQTYYRDWDSDGFGVGWDTKFSCLPSPDSLWSLNPNDCNDWDTNIFPGAPEICDDMDNNCNGMVDDGLTMTPYFWDNDGDGYGSGPNDFCNDPGAPYTLNGGDCTDSDTTINPGAAEICDGIDNNCNGQTDEGVITTYYYDNDGDGFGSWSNNYCFDPGAPYVLAGGDCNDFDVNINPAVVEICDGLDNNCDSAIDEGFPESKIYYNDGDNDGYGGTNMQQSCVLPGPGWILYGGDCADWDPTIYPGADEVCNGMDDNCNGVVDEGFGESLTYYRDWDADGYGADWDFMNSCNPPDDTTYSLVGGDCINGDPTINPGATEICDGMDNNCNGEVDEGTGVATYYRDNDLDGYGVDWITTVSCTPPDSSWATTGGDCEDWNFNVNPGAAEICDGWDNNCNAMTDEGFTFQTYYWDSDGDGYGVSWSTMSSCQPLPNWALIDGDCDNNNAARFPGNPEVCDDYDNDCNGFINDSLTYNIWYWDQDGDGYGGTNTQNICYIPDSTWSLNGGDCADWNPSMFPGNPEICDGSDNDCNSLIDDSLTFTTYYYDNDLDGYGSWSQDYCSDPGAPYVLTGGDCDDSNFFVNPGTSEICNNMDDNCDGMIDDGLTFTNYYYDGDGDGYGENTAYSYCFDPGLPYVLMNGDCDNWNNAIYPVAIEICDGYDNNCDSNVDEGFPNIGPNWWYYDNDLDAYGGVYFNYAECDPGAGYVTNAGDCNDAVFAINPLAAEINCDSIDNNCNWVIDEGDPIYYYDGDGDTYGGTAQQGFCADPGSPWVLTGGDCNDGDNTIFPGNPELCDGKDNNCDASIDEGLTPEPATDYYLDFDGDTWGNMYAGNFGCLPSAPYVTSIGDCNDANPEIYPTRLDTCNGIDDDCDAWFDEDAAFTTYYYDYDGDGFGDELTTISACSNPGPEWSLNIDCQEWNPAVFPGNPEICDGIDNDCNTFVDDGLIFTTYYKDIDLDTYGVDWWNESICYIPDSSWSLTSGDCNDNDPAINPAAIEICDNIDNDCNTFSDDSLIFTTYYQDSDYDGYGQDMNTIFVCYTPDSTWALAGGDCDDWNAAINPGVLEICDAIDNDCSGSADDGIPWNTYYKDEDYDGYGGGMSQFTCNTPDSTWVMPTLDCDDWNSSVYPGALEICDGLDNNCNGLFDELLTFNTYYSDNDGDGFGVDWNTTSLCSNPGAAWSLTGGDCDDWNFSVNPGAAEICNGMDDNCNGMYEEGLTFNTYYYDNDGDGFGVDWSTASYCNNPGWPWSLLSGDCDDSNPAVNPGMAEICNGKDENCNGAYDEGLPVEPLTSFYYDNDMDGFGQGLAGNLICAPGPGFSTITGDCNDFNPGMYPGNAEVCDGLDNDCNGTIDDSFTESTSYYNDGDADGFGDNWYIGYFCADPGAPWLLTSGDCNDMDSLVNPAAIEFCDGIDNNCNGMPDDSCAMTTYFYDGNDNDGFGSWPQDFSFNPGSPYTLLGGDCDEWNPLINPGAIEKCDGKDNNCDGFIDEGFPSTLYYYDGDNDTFGDDSNIKQTCSSVSPVWVLTGGDCQPWNPAVNPGAIEICNEIDDNCDGMVDEGFAKSTYYYDGNDNDGFGNDWNTVQFCADPGFPWSSLSGDCNELDATINPGAVEFCDYIDNNCNGVIDEGFTKTTYYNDMDIDGFGSWSYESCDTLGLGWSLVSGDCDDNNPAVNPGMIEVCNNIDDNCDGVVDEGFSPNTYFYDGDNDGYGEFSNFMEFCLNPGMSWSLTGGDCEPWDAATYPGATEVCDGKDNNCDGKVDEGLSAGPPVTYFKDDDADGFGGGWGFDLTCTPDSSLTTTGGDCNDWDPTINPAAAEIPCNGIDENCDGIVDEIGSFTLFTDWDQDGYGGTIGYFCNPNPGYPWIAMGGDCNDSDPSTSPGAIEVCNGKDDNCDGVIDEGCSLMTYYYDGNDWDGYGSLSQDFYYIPGPDWSTMGGDCEEWNAAINPGATEICDGKDNNCDGLVDEGFPETGLDTYYYDWDMDGYGGGFAGNFLCTPDSNLITISGDCNDSDPLINPAGVEICNNMDDNCDGMVDEGFSKTTYYNDNDNDGFGSWVMESCDTLGFGWSLLGGDCEDWNPMIYPGAIEICDNMDNNCDGTVDEGSSKTTYYNDGDNDGYGTWSYESCDTMGFGWSLLGGDCAEWDASINPGALEICNGQDDNCDGTIDEGFSESTVYYYDADFDGYGVDWNTMMSCVDPGPQWSLLSGDCDEWNASTNPVAPEICDNMDNNCDGTADEGFVKTTYFTDWDQDAYGGWAQDYCSNPGWPWILVGGDCEDNKPEINPGAVEVCNDADDNCDGMVDEGFSKTTYYKDDDGDGYGSWGQDFCVDPGFGWSLTGGDCEDWKFNINPAAIEKCNGYDDNCNGFVDEGLADGSPATDYFWDGDWDGFGGPWAGTFNCTPDSLANLLTTSGDCNDNDVNTYPGAPEIPCDGIDQNCDGVIDEGSTFELFKDGDGDGYGNVSGFFCIANPGWPWIPTGGDCADWDAASYPGAIEVCDGKDNNCDGIVDEGCAVTTYFQDNDNDGFGGFAQDFSFNPGIPWILVGGDCDDNNPMINPLSTEICNGKDDNCDGAVDEGFPFNPPTSYYFDGDADGFGSNFIANLICIPGAELSANPGDCNDMDASINPGAVESCNGIDDNCDGVVDEGFAQSQVYYKDNDADGFGADWDFIYSCVDPGSPWTLANGDCADWDPMINPAAVEICDNMDNNCDGVVDEGFAKTTYFTDGDNDGYGSMPMDFCVDPGMGWSLLGADCIDWDINVNPGATEICNGMDDNCDGAIDEGFAPLTYYFDNDADGYGVDWNTKQSCIDPGFPWTLTNGDCDDFNPSINPGGIEICNGIDDNCDGLVDEGFITTTYYRDVDMDNYGNDWNWIESCFDPGLDWRVVGGDCDDNDPSINPGAIEVCNEKDDNCDGVIDEGFSKTTYYWDNDGDGYGDWGMDYCADPGMPYVLVNGDCDDLNPTVNPGASELCDGLDNNCEGSVDEGLSAGPGADYWFDNDGDTYGGMYAGFLTCTVGPAVVTNDADCDDNNIAINPAAAEVPCNGIDDNCDGVVDEGAPFALYADMDGDGWGRNIPDFFCADPGAPFMATSGDCDDANPGVNPGLVELCNGIDDNCDGVADEGFLPVTYYADADGDTYGDDFNTLVACVDPGAPFITNGGDCNDSDPAINIGAIEVCDGIDNNCDGAIDEGVKTTYYADNDGDSFGDALNTTLDCSTPAGYVSDISDCDDAALLYEDLDGDGFGSGVLVACGVANNSDCDDTAYQYEDLDGDGFGSNVLVACGLSNNTDCNDSELQYLDVDNDGFGSNTPVDCGVADSSDCDDLNWLYEDLDGDGYGSNVSIACGILDNSDCNDSDATVNTSGIEVCDSIDNNCDGFIDEGTQTTYYADADGDTYGDAGNIALDCSAPAGYVSDNSDCNDADASVNPSGIEVCDSIDNNCDGAIDEGTQTTYYADADGDTYGDAGNTILDCSAPAGYVSDNTDCNDADASVNPSGIEVCDSIDNNCDGSIDEGTQSTFYADNDGDTYGDAGNTALDCSAPLGYVSDNTDCNDADASVNPSGIEVCDGIDNNCDGAIDDGVQTIYFADADGDTYGDAGNTISDCSAPVGYVSDNTDCDDLNGGINPGASEICDGVDNNCDGSIDEGTQTIYYADADSDTYGDAGNTTSDCSAPVGYVSDNTDCNDLDSGINPGSVEVCDGVDNNCDGSIDEGTQSIFYADTDSDTYGDPANTTSDCVVPVGYVFDNTDCNDTVASINPGAADVCDGIDNNCDGSIDEDGQTTFYADLDGDTYGDAANSKLDCSVPVGYVSDSTDCNDLDSGINPGATEIVDGVDNNCDGSIDNVSINEELSQLANSVEVYPVPAYNFVNFKFTANIPDNNLTLNVKDVKGRLVLSKSISAGKKGDIIGLDVKELNQGIYQVIITGDSFKASTRLIITK